MVTKRLLPSLLFALVMGCSGSDGGGPTGPAGLTLSNLVGVWNIALNLTNDSCGFGAPEEFIDAWEFAASPDEIPGFVADGEFYNAVFDDASGFLSFTAQVEGVTIAFDGRFTSATQFSGTFQAVSEGCTVTYSVDANKLGA